MLLLPTTVFAQASIYKLPSNKSAIGLGYTGSNGFHTLLMNLDYGFTDNVKGSAITALSFQEDVNEYLYVSELLQLVYIDSIASTGLDYFLIAGVAGTYLIESQTSSSLNNFNTDSGIRNYYQDEPDIDLGSGLQTFTVAGGGGISTKYGPFNPFVSYSYNYIMYLDIGNASTSIFGAGIEFDLSRKISLIGRLNSRLTADGFHSPTYEFAINFHSAKKVEETRVETPPTTVSVKKVEEARVETPPTSLPDKKVEEPKVETPQIPVSYRYKKNDILLVKVKNYIYFAKVSDDTITTAKEVPVQFFIREINLIAGNNVVLNAVQAKWEKPKDGWGSQKVTIEYYDGTEWKTVSDVLVFEDFYLLPESVQGERRIGIDKIRIPTPQ